MKNRGFTLVELLVAIVIMGIITAIAIPMIRNIREGNEDKQYKVYADSLKDSAKLYLDSYEEDLFGREDSGCAIVSYEKLKEKELAKDIPIENVTCAVDETFVKIVKLDGKYGYSTSLVCGEIKAGDNFHEIVRIPKEGISNSDICSVASDVIMAITAQPSNSTSISYKKRNIVLKIHSDTGIDVKPSLSYGFSLDKSSNVIDGWGTVSLTVPGREQQKNDILDGHSIEIESNKISTPEGVSGDYYLVVKVNKLLDITGKSWKKEELADGEGAFLYFGPYKVDNTPPEFNDSTILSGAGIPTLNLNATDNMSSENDMKMCISYDSDTCSKKTKDIKNNYRKYNKNMLLQNTMGLLDGKHHTVYITIADAAGNYSSTSYDVEFPMAINYHYNLNGSGTIIISYCQPGVDCTIKDYFNANYYTGLSWNTSAAGDGTTYHAGDIVQLTDGLDLYAQWRQNYLNIRYYAIGTTRAVSLADGTTLENGSGYFEFAGTPSQYFDANTLSSGLGSYHSNSSENPFYFTKLPGFAATTVWVYDSSFQKNNGTSVGGRAGTQEIDVGKSFAKRVDLLKILPSDDANTLQEALKTGDITVCLKPKMMACTWLVSNPYGCYNTLTEAVAAAVDNTNTKITLMRNASRDNNVEQQIKINKSLSLDFGGHTFSMGNKDIAVVSYKTVNIVGSGTLTGTATVLSETDGSKISFSGAETIIRGCSSDHGSTPCTAVQVRGRFEMRNGTITAPYGSAVWVGHGGTDSPTSNKMTGTFYMTGGTLEATKNSSNATHLQFMSTLEAASNSQYSYTIDGKEHKYTVYITGGTIIRKLKDSDHNCCIKIRGSSTKYCKTGGTLSNQGKARKMCECEGAQGCKCDS
ncbi:MAG: type II secretion system protein [Bacilli bacterium]|nr:type II secretion system protein [Bacilli bacterium]